VGFVSMYIIQSVVMDMNHRDIQKKVNVVRVSDSSITPFECLTTSKKCYTVTDIEQVVCSPTAQIEELK
jgi:hypothetical protein